MARLLWLVPALLLSGAGCSRNPPAPENVGNVPGKKENVDAGKKAPSKGAYEERLIRFFDAIDKGQVSRVKEILEEGGDVNDKDDRGEPPLVRAVVKNQPAVVKLLLSRGAMVGNGDAKGQTALMRAAESDNLLALKTLLEGVPKDAKAPPASSRLGLSDLYHRDESGQTALMKAAAAGHAEAARLLLTHAWVVPRFSNTADWNEAIRRNDAWVNARDRQGESALALAAGNGHAEGVRALLSYRRDIWVSLGGGSQGLTDPGHADLTVANDRGQTALMKAAAGGHLEVVNALLGPDVNISLPDVKARQENVARRDKAGKTARSHAEEKGHKDVAKRLKEIEDQKK